jgi:anti-sigma B factor antagonist
MMDVGGPEITVAQEGNRVRVCLRGALDLASGSSMDATCAALSSRRLQPALVLLDLGGVTFCDSSGLRALLRVTDRLTRQGTNVRLANVPAQTRRVLQLTGTLARFGIEPVGRS